MKPLKTRPLIGEIAAQRLWGKGTATPRVVDVLDGTLAQQRAFIEDPAKLKWALCTRRAAKSYSDGLALAKAALDRPDVSCLYIGLTRESAKRIMWKDVLKAINRRHKLGVPMFYWQEEWLPIGHRFRTEFSRWSENQALTRVVRDLEWCPVAITNSLCVNYVRVSQLLNTTESLRWLATTLRRAPAVTYRK